MVKQDSEKIVLITGSTDGIGKQTALEIAEFGHYVYVHGRKRQLVYKVIDEIKSRTGNTKIEGFTGDFSSLEEVRKLAKDIIGHKNRLDVLVNNAGVLRKSFGMSKDGFELTFAVNHLAPFFLTNLLLGILKKGQQPRIVNVASEVHSRSLDLKSLPRTEEFDGMREYSISKLCNVLFTYKLARDLKEYGITANCLHPGVVNTKMLIGTWGRIGAPVEKGAETSVYLALSNEVSFESGKYYRNRKAVRSAPVSYNIEVQEELWKISEQIIKSVINRWN
ncbi:MAG: SDR family oxidoreductase [Bacteroidales bacterium]|nr:MAG: SDR family oxidoreductase [Bacteroidales bacterium]